MATEIPGAEIGDRHPLALALFALTFVSGVVDAVSYLGLGRVFTANMTGNVVIVGFALGGAPGFSVLDSLVSLGFFLLGSVASGRVTRELRPKGRQFWFRRVLLAEAVLEGAAALVAATAPAVPHAVLIAVLAVALGLRNATVRALGVPDLTTTVLTMTLTGFAADSPLAGAAGTRWSRRLGSALTMLAGAALGAALTVHTALGWPLLLAALLVAATAVLYREP
jgi:uncharacterized membrane protein YoaK (UPF0700 family)